jgi:hypothetical protein
VQEYFVCHAEATERKETLNSQTTQCLLLDPLADHPIPRLTTGVINLSYTEAGSYMSEYKLDLVVTGECKPTQAEFSTLLADRMPSSHWITWQSAGHS